MDLCGADEIEMRENNTQIIKRNRTQFTYYVNGFFYCIDSMVLS